jgi:hypothetical protein
MSESVDGELCEGRNMKYEWICVFVLVCVIASVCSCNVCMW